MARDGSKGHKLSDYMKLNDKKERKKKQIKVWKHEFKIRKGKKNET